MMEAHTYGRSKKECRILLLDADAGSIRLMKTYWIPQQACPWAKVVRVIRTESEWNRFIRTRPKNVDLILADANYVGCRTSQMLAVRLRNPAIADIPLVLFGAFATQELLEQVDAAECMPMTETAEDQKLQQVAAIIQAFS